MTRTVMADVLLAEVGSVAPPEAETVTAFVIVVFLTDPTVRLTLMVVLVPLASEAKVQTTDPDAPWTGVVQVAWPGEMLWKVIVLGRTSVRTAAVGSGPWFATVMV